MLCMKYDYKFLVEDISNTVTSNCFIILISKCLFSVAIKYKIHYDEDNSLSLDEKCFST